MNDTPIEEKRKGASDRKARDKGLEEGLKESFPASDPPASTRPGENDPVPSSGYDEKQEKRKQSR